MGINEKVVLSNKAQIQYLSRLIGKILKILYLIEEEVETQHSPLEYLRGQLLELSSANELFNGDLVTIIVKLNLILNNYDTLKYKEKRKQILEINNQINYLITLRKGE